MHIKSKDKKVKKTKGSVQNKVILYLKKSSVFFLLLLSFNCFAQEVISIDGADCGMHGSARAGTEAYALDAYKNRYNFPKKSDYDLHINLQDLASSADPNQFSVNKAVIIRGYVFDVKVGGIETCNCKTKDPQFRDTHIELTPDENETDKPTRVIVEVTPRLRAMMAKKGIDWSTTALRHTIKGHKVEVAGWLFYDDEHETEAYANDPDDAIGRRNWRATCWEVHPITSLKIIDGMNDNMAKTIPPQTDEHNAQDTAQQPASHHANYTWLIIIGIIAVIIVLYFMQKKSSSRR